MVVAVAGCVAVWPCVCVALCVCVCMAVWVCVWLCACACAKLPSSTTDQTAPALSSMTATGATTGGSVTVTASIDEAATVFCATQSASAATDMTVTAVIDAGNSVAVGASGSFTTTFSSSLNNAAVDVLCVARDSWENTGASATVVADVTVGAWHL